MCIKAFFGRIDLEQVNNAGVDLRWKEYGEGVYFGLETKYFGSKSIKFSTPE